MEELHHECGVFGIYGVDNAAQYAYYALHSLQHRGQQGCGIVSVDKQGMHLHKGAGLVIEIFGEKHLDGLTGNIAIGHVRYPTTNVGGMENIQPLPSIIIPVILPLPITVISSIQKSCGYIWNVAAVCFRLHRTVSCLLTL